MLAREDHVAGERSRWWERIMLVENDHVGGKGSCGCCKMVNYCKSRIVAPEKIIFAQKGLPSVRSQHKSQQTICQLAADLILWGCWGRKIATCRDNAEKIQRTFYKVFLNFSLNRSTVH